MSPKKLALCAAILASTGLGSSAQAVLDTQPLSWEPELLPSLYLDFGSTTQIVNLAPSTRLETKKARQGYRVVNTSVRALGLGVENSLNVENTAGLAQGFFVSVGIRPVLGREVKSISHARDLHAVEAILENRSLPASANDLRDWHSGDSVAYTAKGGVLFFGGAGFLAASVTATYLAQGEFQTYVEKLDDTHALVKITDSHLDSVGLKVGNIIATTGANRFHKLADALSYRINLSTREGARAFSEMIKGNVAAAQKIAMLGSDVQAYEKSKLQQSGNTTEMYIGVPILLNTTLGTGKVNELNLTQSFRNNTFATTHYGIYLNEQKTNQLTKQKNTTEAFYGSSFQLHDAESHLLKRGYFGQYFWSFSTNKSSGESLTAAMQEIVRKTGLGSLLKLPPPKGEDLGYSSVSLRLHFGESKMKHATALATRMTKQKLLTAVESMIESYLTNSRGDIDGACAYYSGECSLALLNETNWAISEMHDAANDMQAAMVRQDGNAYTDASARFGKSMMANQFTFQTAVLLAGGGVAMDYIVEGRDLARYTLTLESTNDPGRLFVRSQRGLITEGALYR